MFGDLLVLNKQSNGSALTLEPLSQGPLCRQRLAAAKRALWDKGGGYSLILVGMSLLSELCYCALLILLL